MTGYTAQTTDGTYHHPDADRLDHLDDGVRLVDTSDEIGESDTFDGYYPYVNLIRVVPLDHDA